MRFLIVAISLTCSVGFAQTPAEQPASPPSAGRGSSSRRAEKVWGWAGQAGDLYFGGQSTIGYGATGFYYLNPNAILSIEMGVGGNTDFLSSIGGDTVNGDMVRFGVFYKQFLVSSLYVKGGLEERTIHYKVSHYPAFGGGAYYQTADVNLYSLWVGIGNQWEIARHLVIGCDWVGASLPIANSGFSETDSGTPFSVWNLHSRLTAYGSLDVTRFYIGMSY